MLRLAPIAVFLALAQCLIAEQCAPDKHNPCIASCNGTTFDISKLFHYPHNITDGPFDQYIWSPCKGYACPDYKTPTGLTAVCQIRDFAVNCGNYQQPIFILERTDPYMFTIEYPSGTDWRVSIFQFIISDDHPEIKVSFLGERPNLQYNFQVLGQCIGQPQCKKSGPNPFH